MESTRVGTFSCDGQLSYMADLGLFIQRDTDRTNLETLALIRLSEKKFIESSINTDDDFGLKIHATVNTVMTKGSPKREKNIKFGDCPNSASDSTPP